MGNYIVDFTNINVSPITIEEAGLDVTSTDISLFGRIRLEYGELLNESLLHLLENFACPEDPLDPGNPDLATSHETIFENPTEGQFWFNSTTNILYSYDGTGWVPLRGVEDVAANWGTIGSGEQLPKPVSPTTGYEFDYEECIWSVAPAAYESSPAGMNCYTDSEANVTMEYINQGSTYEGHVNYLIIGVRGNNNLGEQVTPPPLPGATPTPTITPSTTFGASPTPTITPTNTPNATPVISPPSTPDITPTPSPIPPLGQDARCYVSPAPCDPGTPGPGGTAWFNEATCGVVSKSAYDISMYFSIQGLSGGVPPYTVNFNEFYTDMPPTFGDPSGLGPWGYCNDPSDPGDWVQGPCYPDSCLSISYFGGESGGAKLRINVSPGEIVYVRVKFSSAEFNYVNDYTGRRIRAWGKIKVSDSVGNNIHWWIPSTETYPTVGYKAGCPFGGTNNTGPDAIPGLPGTINRWVWAAKHYGCNWFWQSQGYADACEKADEVNAEGYASFDEDGYIIP
jgi:hypothetical protein